jgi:hypothetical protein
MLAGLLVTGYSQEAVIVGVCSHSQQRERSQEARFAHLCFLLREAFGARLCHSHSHILGIGVGLEVGLQVGLVEAPVREYRSNN